MKMVVCTNCRAQLLTSPERAPVCGKCGQPVLIPVERRPGLWTRMRALLFGSVKTTPGASPEHVSAHGDLESKAFLLARKTWGAREDIVSRRLTLPLDAVKSCADPSDLIAILLRHARGILPNISVPMMTPRIAVERSLESVGQFVEQDGWIKITVDPYFFQDLPAARSILCHELCHYILLANGIRQSPTIENERLTDVAMFAFGFGDIFLAGYKRNAAEYRPGHRLGYLSDAEYTHVSKYVADLRKSETFLRSAKRQDDWRWDRSLR